MCEDIIKTDPEVVYTGISGYYYIVSDCCEHCDRHSGSVINGNLLNNCGTFKKNSLHGFSQLVTRKKTHTIPFTLHGPRARGSNPGGGEIIRNRPDRPWGSPSLQYYGYRVSFPGEKRPGRDVDHPPHLVPSLKKE